MLDYLALICLLALCVGHYYLIRGCMNMGDEASSIRHTIDMKLAESNNLLNEIAEILDDVQQPSVTSQPAQTGNPLLNLLLQQFIPTPQPSESHATTSEERAIYEIDPTTTQNTQDDQRGEHSTKPVGA